jgi:uncharacterized protein
MALPPYLKPHPEGVCLCLKVQPRASHNEIGEPLGEELKLKVTAPPADSAANEAVLRYLAEILGCPRGSVHLLRGNTSRHKQILLRGLSAEAVSAKLADAR